MNRFYQAKKLKPIKKEVGLLLNTLGQMKVLLDIQILRGFSERSTPHGQTDRPIYSRSCFKQSLAQSSFSSLHPRAATYRYEYIRSSLQTKEFGSALPIPRMPLVRSNHPFHLEAIGEPISAPLHQTLSRSLKIKLLVHLQLPDKADQIHY